MLMDSVSLIKTINEPLIIPLTKFINKCIAAKMFCGVLNVASVIPTYKKVDEEDLSID